MSRVWVIAPWLVSQMHADARELDSGPKDAIVLLGNTYQGHTFFFTQKNNKKKVLARYLMVADKVIFYSFESIFVWQIIDCRNADMCSFVTKKFLCFQYTYVVQNPKDPPPKKFTEQAAREEKFHTEYLNKTGKIL